MLFNKGPKSEQVSQSIDAEIERKVGERLRDIEERLDQRVQQTVHGDREFVKDTIGVAFKIAGFAVAVVVVVLGALGWKTFSAVYTAMTDAAARKADEYFSTPQGRLVIDSTLDHAVLDSCLVRIALMNSDKSAYKKLYTKLMIDDHDADRLLRIVNSDKYDDAMFRSAANVLILAFNNPDRSSSSMVTEVGNAFAAFIAPKDKDAKWLEKNRTRRRWLLEELGESRFSEGQIKVACRQLISSDASDDLKLPAITYLGTINDHEALDKLIGLAGKGKELSGDAVLAVAKIDPKRDVVRKWTADLGKIINPSVETIAIALKISEVLGYGGDEDTALKLLEYAMHHSRLSVYVYQTDSTKDYVLMLSDIEGQHFSNIPSTIFFFGEDDWTHIVDQMLRRSAQQPDLNNFRRLVGWLTMRGRNILVRVRLRILENSAITLQDGKKLDKRSAPDGVVMVPEHETKDGKQDQITILWTDTHPQTFLFFPGQPILSPEKQDKSGVLANFENGKDLIFEREMQ
jgi:hypothetical protein